MQEVENNILFRFFSYLLCLLVIWGYGIFIYLSIFESEFLFKAVGFSVILTVGYIWSWYNRYSNQVFVKIILALMMILVGINFFRTLPESVYDPRIPLLELLISLLLIHSFDLPRRKDLLYSITSSLIVLIVLTAISSSILMIPFIVLFVFLFFLVLFVMDLGNKNLKDLYKLNLIFTFSVLVSGFLLFLFLPKPLVGNYFFRIVFAPKEYSDGIQNLPHNPKIYQKKIENIFSKSYTYRNFRREMDLTSRGLLPHILVMKVKAPYITYIKGIHLIYYDGKRWYNKQEKEEQVVSGEYSYFSFPIEFYFQSFTSINTYFMIFEDLPDILYHIPVPSEAFFPSNYLKMKDYNFYSEYPLVKGMTYTINSKIPFFDFNKLKTINFNDYTIFFSRICKQNSFYYNYISLDEVSKEVAELAYNLTKNEPTLWGKVEILKAYLEKNYTYDLFINVPKTDAVYDFLFIQKRGYCEQFASALAVMLRTIGIPSRVVLGYLPQKRDIFTGFIEVYSDDAHSWVEILSPFGWVPVDPSPSNVDENTLKYLESKSRNYLVSAGLLSDEFAENLLVLFNAFLRINLLMLITFLGYRIFIFSKRKLIIDYLKGIDIENLNTQNMKKAFLKFMEYFRMKNIELPSSLTLREIKVLQINDPFFEKFKKFIDIYEKYIYGPKL